jgi:hypothetical protein
MYISTMHRIFHANILVIILYTTVMVFHLRYYKFFSSVIIISENIFFHMLLRTFQNCGKVKDIPVTGCEGPLGCETLRLPHFLDNQLTDGGEVVSHTCPLPFTPQEDSWYSFLLEAESTPGPQCSWKD